MPSKSKVFYIIIKGIMDGGEKGQRKITNISKDDDEFKPKKVGEKEKRIFDTRRTAKDN